MALFKRKDKDTKKGGETTIGKIIYGFLLFMPLLSIGARCLYVILNKNAYESYSTTQSTNFEYEDNVTSLVKDNFYHFTVNDETRLHGQNVYAISEFVRFGGNWNNNAVINRFQNYHSENGWFIHTYYQEGNTTSNHSYTQYANASNVLTQVLSFNFQASQDYSTYSYSSETQHILFVSDTHLDNVFEYSINQTQQSNIYNWAKQTGTYTVLHNTTTGLGITNEFIPMLMAYWLIISVIYFLFDIALILIWAVHKKIHELSEAI